MIISVLILSVLGGVFLGELLGKNQKIAKKLLVVSAGFLITICVNEVLPEVYEVHDHNIGIWIVGGVVIQMLLETLTKGFEHGHLHHNEECNVLPLGLVVGMFIHAFLEGIPLATETHLDSPYLLGIIFHNLPISFVLGNFLLKNKKIDRVYSWAIILIFAIASPLGMMLGEYFDPNLKPYFLALVGGIFLHISTVIIFESNKNHKMDWEKLVLVLSGIGIALLLHTFHSHH